MAEDTSQQMPLGHVGCASCHHLMAEVRQLRAEKMRLASLVPYWAVLDLWLTPGRDATWIKGDADQGSG